MPRQTAKPAKPTKRARRRKGEGAVFVHKKSGLWSAIANLGLDERGKRKRRQVYGQRESEVLAKLSAIKFEVASGRAAEKPTRQTLGSFLTDWLEDVVKPSLRPTSHHSYTGIVVRHVLGPRGIGHVRLRDLKPQTLTAFYARLKASGVGDRSRQLTHAVLRRALGYALRQEIIGRNVAKLVDAPKYAASEMRPLTITQAKKFLEVAKSDRLAALYTLAIMTGLREGECMGLTWADVDLKKATAQVKHTMRDVGGVLSVAEVKTEKSRRLVHLPRLAVTALQAHRKQTQAEGFPITDKDLVFLSPKGHPLRYQYLAKYSFKPLLEAANLPDTRFHTATRHTFATALLGLGVHGKVAQEALGHATIGTTLDIYSHVTGTLGRAAAKQLDTAFAPKSKKARKSK